MELKVKEVNPVEEKSVQEVEEQLEELRRWVIF